MPNVPVMFTGKFPPAYANSVRGWSFDKDTMRTNVGKLLTLDIDFGNRCSLNCGHCFRRNGVIDALDARPLAYDQIIDVVEQAQDLGLRTVKILGAGEPFEEPLLLDFLRYLNSREIYAVVFTKGLVLGSDFLAGKYFGQSENVHSAEDLVHRLECLDVSIVLGFQSFDTIVQDGLVGHPGYTLARNRALELLCKYNFNKLNPTRLSLAALPVTKKTIGEVFEIYCWGRERDMYPIVCPSMCSGRASNAEYRESITPSEDELVALYTQIYRYNLERGIQAIDQVWDEGVAAYAGGAPCTQIACGMYITSKGVVLRCPGDDVTVLGDVRKDTLANIWRGSENYVRGNCSNCHCPPKDGKTIPIDLYSRVLAKLI